jgi:hypothetical protein
MLLTRSMRYIRMAAALFFISTAAAMTAAAEKPVAPEQNPPGDIPDTQVFVTYASPLGFSIKVPEGWARTAKGSSVRFSDKYDAIEVTMSSSATAPTVDSISAGQVPESVKAGRAVKILKVKQIKLKGSPAVLVSYTSNSEPNPVTNKQIRLERDCYLFYRDGKLAALDMAAPQGADNVDDWMLIANSFRWK